MRVGADQGHAERRAAAARAARAGRRSGSTPAGRPSTARIHVGNARPFVVFSLLTRFLEHEGYEATLVDQRHRHQRQDLRRRARGRASPSAELARRDDRRLRRGHRPARARPPRRRAAGHRDDRRDRRADRGPDRARPRLRVGRRRLLPRAQLRRLRQALQPRPRRDGPGRGGRAPSAKEDPLDFALWKARKEDEDTAWDVALGRGPARLAHRVLGDGREAARRRLRDPRRRLDLVFPHHENEIAQTEAARGVPLARIWMHNGMVQIDEREDVEVGRQHLPALRGARPLRAATRGRLLRLRPLPPAARVLRGGARARRRPGSSGSATSSREPPADGRARRIRGSSGARRFLDALADDFNTPRALAALFELVAEGNRRELAGRARGARGDAAAARARGAARGGRRAPTRRPSGCSAEREEARAGARLRRGRPAPRRAGRARLGGPRHARGRRGSCRRA